MPSIYPYRAVQYRAGVGDVSDLVAPPYDVLDAESKAALLAKNPGNVVGIDLPHVPAKQLGPPETYQSAAAAYQNLLAVGTLSQRDTPAIFAYRQTFTFEGHPYQRCGISCTIDAVPFGTRPGGGVLPHEQTFGGPKEDRMALMQATQSQLSPIFGLYSDTEGLGTQLVRKLMASREPDMTADMNDGVTHEVWTIEDAETIEQFADALAGQDVFVADGHHRYNTALNYLKALETKGDLPEDHPARRTMFVLISMADPGLAIGPTHRVLGGMEHWSMDKFIDAAAGLLNVEAIDNDPKTFESQIEFLANRENTNVFGLFDYSTGLCFAGWPAVPDPLEDQFPDKPESWRKLDVAIVQHLIVEQVCKPELNNNLDIKWAFPHTIEEMLALGRGVETSSSIEGGGRPQLAVVVRPTPLDAVREISLADELMPQKSTFFYPKIATGLFMNPLS
ncbi:MAG: DUF1015 family protein [Phycisphaerales bacterium]